MTFVIFYDLFFISHWKFQPFTWIFKPSIGDNYRIYSLIIIIILRILTNVSAQTFLNVKMSHLTNVLLPQTSYHHSLPISTMYQSPIGFQWFALQQKFIPIFFLFYCFFSFFLLFNPCPKTINIFFFVFFFSQKKICGFLCSHICDLFIICY
jgi:hypothetical protein